MTRVNPPYPDLASLQSNMIRLEDASKTPMKNHKTTIIYRADSLSAPGWEERQLMPSGSITDILAQTWSFSDRVPKVGDRVREYLQTGELQQVTHGREGDWIVDRVSHFSSEDTEECVIICDCQFKPIASEWEELDRQDIKETAIA